MASIQSEMPSHHAAEALSSSANNSSTNQTNLGSENSSHNAASSTTPSTGNGQGTTAAAGTASTPSTPTSGVAPNPTNLIGSNTISAAADSSDNQPGTPQPPSHLNESQQNQSSNGGITHQPYASHHMYGSSGPPANMPNMYGAGGGGGVGVYGQTSQEMQQQQQQLQQQQHAGYPSYMNSYEQFYQQQQQQQQQPSNNCPSSNSLDYNGSNVYGNDSGGVGPTSDYKSPSVRFHPYLQTPTSGLSSSSGNANTNNANDRDNSSNPASNPLPNGNVSTTSVMSPRVVSSTSPTSTSSTLQMGSISSVNPSSPSCKLQCKKCGIMCTNESELQEHIANAHGESPYGSSGYASSPYIKEEMHSQQSTPTQQSSQQQQQQTQQQVGGSGNPNDLLDLDQQKALYPGMGPGNMAGHMMPSHHNDGLNPGNDPLHSMHSMQQRAMPDWNHQQEGLPPYMQQQQPQQNALHPDPLGKGAIPNQSPYYSPKQSPFHPSGNGVIKQEFPMIKSEYADSQYSVDKSFDPTAGGNDLCQPPSAQQQQQQGLLPVATSPAEFPSTTTGGPQDQQQQYRSFEPPSSSSAMPMNNLATKAATWKSNEARRPKTYNCTACNKWFTSSGHLKRHYNTTLHKNAVKSSGQPDPATLPISAHHHPTRDPTGKPRRGGGRQQAQHQPQPPQPTQPPEPPRTPPDFAGPGAGAMGLGQMSHYSSSPSPNHLQQQHMQMNGGIPYGQANGYPPHHLQQQQQQQHNQYMQQVQSTTNASPQHASNSMPSTNNTATNLAQHNSTVLNGHPNGLAGPSAQATPMPSSLTRGLLNTTATTATALPTATIKNEIMEDTISPMDMEMLQAQQQAQQQQLQQEQDHQQHHQQQHLIIKEEMLEDPQLQHHQQQQHHQYQGHQDSEEVETMGVLEEQPSVVHYHHQQQQQQLVEDRHYHNSTPSSTHSNSMRVQSPLIISHQQYQEQLQRAAAAQQEQSQMVRTEEDNIFSHTPPPPQQQQVHMHLQPHNMVDQQQLQQQYTHLGINTPPPQHSNNMQLLQQQHITTHTAATTNMDNIHTMLPSLHHQQQLEQDSESASVSVSGSVLPPMHNTLLSNTNIQSQQQQLDTIHSTTTHTPPPQQLITTTQQQLPPLQPTTNTIPSFQQLQQASGLVPHLEPTMTYHTIIGNSHSPNNSNSQTNEYMQLTALDPYGNLIQPQQMITTADGQILQIIPASQMVGQQLFTLPSRASVAESYTHMPHYAAQRSPQEGDLPPAHTLTHPQMHLHQESQTLTVLPSMPYSPTISSSTTMTIDEYNAAATAHNNNNHIKQEVIQNHSDNLISTTLVANSSTSPDSVSPGAKKPSAPRSRGAAQKRKRTNSMNEETLAANGGATLPSGRIKCLQCDKEFTKNCYLTQHNKSFHSGEYPFRCQKCGKRFQSEGVYTVHLGRHKTLDKPHKCELCPKQFHHKTDLRRHIEAIHTGMKQHICDICEKSFCRKDHLRKHMETHNRPRVVVKKSQKNQTQTSITNFNNSSSTNTNNNNIVNSNDDDRKPKITQVFSLPSLSANLSQKFIKLTDMSTMDNSSRTLMLQQHAAAVYNQLSNIEENDVAPDDDSLVKEDPNDMSIEQNEIKTEYQMIEQEIHMY